MTVPCLPNDFCAGPCPAGSYCPEGIETPIPCPEHTLRNSTGARAFNDCLPCPAGYWCHQGDPVPELCPAGAYCEEGTGPTDCPVLHYRDLLGGENVTDCFPCVAGYWCNETGMDAYDINPCPVGHYCPEASEPEWCPAGQMRPNVGAASADDCPLCREGYYCPNDTANTMGIPCDETFECPEGTATPIECRPGRYCPVMTGEGLICPAGYVCYNATGSNPDQCIYPEYCPAGSNITYSCPLGYQALNHQGLRTSLERSCSICEAGYYGNHTERKYCEPCPPGHYCPEGTPYGEKYPCDYGEYCPPMTGPTPYLCPIGYYGVQLRAESYDQCAKCGKDTYNNQEGQKACKPCGSSAITDPELGAATCTCIGKYRSYQTSDGACRCQTGYCYYDEADRLVTDSNSDGDCQQCKVPICSSHEIRLPNTGECADPLTFDCTVQCGGETGSLNENGR